MKLKSTHFRYGAYSLLLVCLFALQTARGTSITVWGGSANYLFPFVLSIAMLDGSTAGAVWGLICGILLSTVSGGNAIFMQVSLPVLSGLVGYVLQRYMRSGIGSVALCTGGVVIIWNVASYVFYGAFIGADVLYITKSTIGTLGLTLLFVPVVYLAVHHIFQLTKGDGYE